MFSVRLRNWLLALLTVPECIGCGKRVAGHEIKLCRDCRRRYNTEIAISCSGCGYPHRMCRCSVSSYDGVRRLIHAAPYNPDSYGIVSQLVYNAKSRYVMQNFKFIASECVRMLAKSEEFDINEPTVVTWIPRQRKRIIRVGHDQSRIIARLIAMQLGLPIVKTLVNRGYMPQKKLNLRGRLLNASESYELSLFAEREVMGMNVIIVDDLATTGSTMHVAMSLIRSAGATEVIPLTFARTDRGPKKYKGKRKGSVT